MNLLDMLLCIASLLIYSHLAAAAMDSRSHLIKATTTIMIENDGNAPITQHLIDCDDKYGHPRLSHIVAKLSNDPMPVSKTDDGKMWRIDLSSKPIEPGTTKPLIVTKVYTHLELVPDHDVYLLPYSTIQYQVRIIKQGRPQKIKVPSEQYFLAVDNKELVDLEESTSTALALETEGSTKIRFVDKNVISDEDFIQPESTIHIVNPSYLSMHVLPGESWALQKFTDYTIEVRIYDADQHQIFPSDNLDIQITVGNELVVTNSTTNGTYHTIHTLSSGPSTISARLLGTTPTLYSLERPIQDIEINQDLTIYEALEVKPSAIILPWLPDSKPSYQLSIYAAGGTGSYVWSTNNSALLDLTYTGEDSSVAKVSTIGEGTSFVRCSDTKSTVFSKHSMVVVSRIVEINVLPSITETEIGGDILLPIAVYTNITPLLEQHVQRDEVESGLALFHDCSKIKFSVEVVEKARFTYDMSEVLPNTRPKSCLSLKFTCNQPGSSRVWISYKDSSDPLSKPIKTTTILACYKPLRPVYPTEFGVLALQTSLDIAFEGGPRPFGSRIDDHYAHLEPNKSPIASFEPMIDRFRHNKDLHVFRAHCYEYGELLVTLNVGNQPSATLPNPASSKASIRIICAKPSSMQLRPRLKETCPLNEMASLVDTVVPVSSTLPTDFELLVYDDFRRQFANISSFRVDWHLHGPGTSNLKQVEEVNAVAGYRRVTRNYITIQPISQEGLGRLQADLKHYKSLGLYRGQSMDLAANLDIQFVDYAKINPNKTILLNHLKNVVVLTINKGSGYFTVESLQGTKHANVSYVSVFGQHRINITPLSVGKFTVRLEDQCIDNSQGLPILSELTIAKDIDFSRAALKPGNTLQYCHDVDPSMFCLYLSVEDIESSHITIRQPSTATISHSTTARPTIEPHIIQVPPSTTSKPIPALDHTVKESTTQTPAPKVNFDDSATTHNKEVAQSSLFERAMGFVILIVVTASVILVGHRWWQEKRMRPRNPQFVTDSSFLRQSPTASVRFSPSSSRGPTSSTPRASRPLYTERFSTTLLSD